MVLARVSRSVVGLTFGVGAALVFAPPSAAQTFDVLLPELLSEHEQIKAAQADLESAKYSKRNALGDYLPSVDATANYGWERQYKDEAANTSVPFNEFSLELTQLVTDFGQTTGKIRRADMSVRQAEIQVEATRQGLILEALSAYLGVLSSYESLKLARQSEGRIQEVFGTEEFKVERGSGVASDVLQVRRQLTSARRTVQQLEGVLLAARNRYENVFKRQIEDIDSLRRPRIPLDALPENVDLAVESALKSNLGLRSARLSEDIAKTTSHINKIKLYAPTIELTASANWKDNVSGTLGFKREYLIKGEVSMPILNGGKDMATYYGSISATDATAQRLQLQFRSLEEQIRNAWQQMITNQQNAELARNESNIAAEFLEIARRERQLNRRSLLDVLSGELALLGALSATVQTETAAALAVYNVLFSMGALKGEALIETASLN